MANVIIIDKDERLARQASQLIKELDDRNQYSVFPDDKSFYDRYFSGGKGSDEDIEEGTNPRMSTIDLVIFSMECVSSSPIEFIQETINYIKIFKYQINEEDQCRFVIAKYEDDGVDKFKLMNPLVDDIIFQPYDRLIFLQKIDIILTLPEKATPRYLFSEQVDFDIEISKRTQVQGLSGSGFSIKNPSQLALGTIAHFYLQLPTADSQILDFYGKVIGNEAIADTKQFTVYFSFFGMTKSNQLGLKKFLKEKNYKPLIDINEKHFELSDLNMFATPEEKAIRNVLIVDPDPQACQSITEMLTMEMSCNKVAVEHSYAEFLQKYFAKKKISVNDQIPYATLMDMTLGSIQFTVHGSTLSLEKVGGLYDNKQKIMDRGLEDFFAEPLAWKNLFAHRENEGQLEEAIKIVSGGHAVHKLICIQSETGEEKLFSASFNQKKGHKDVDIKISPPNEEILREIEEMNIRNPRLTKIDVMIINHRLVPMDYDNWYENLTEGARSRGLLTNNKNMKIIIIGEGASDKALFFSQKKVDALINYPVTANDLLLNISVLTNNQFTKYCLRNIQWLDTMAYIYVAKAAKLESISEFGSTIRLPQPIAPGTSLFLHGSIFNEAPNRSLAARFYHSEPHESEHGKFSCSVIYFGINEAFLKYARNWIRDNYASKKNQQVEQ